MRALLAVLLFAFVILAGWWLEHADYTWVESDWLGFSRTVRHCASPPDPIQTWSYTHRERRPEDRANLERWIRENPEDVDRPFGAFCWTPLHHAARFGREDLAQVLINRGVGVESRTETGETPLHLAAQYGNRAATAVLLEHGADPNARNEARKTPLHEAVQGLGQPEDIAARTEVAQLLLSRGADINARDGSGWSPLRYASFPPGGRPSSPRAADPASPARPLIDLLLAAGADVRDADLQGTTQLHKAASHGDTALVRLLLERDAEVGAVDRFSTPLAAAASGGHPETAELLLASGADVNRSVPGSPLEWQGLPLAMALLHPRDTNRDAAVRRRGVARVLLAHGADLSVRNEQGETLLHGVAAAGDSASVALLLSHAAPVDAADTSGFTPLHRAVEEGHPSVAALLVGAGADAGATARDGRRPLDLAAGDPEMEALLRGPVEAMKDGSGR